MSVCDFCGAKQGAKISFARAVAETVRRDARALRWALLLALLPLFAGAILAVSSALVPTNLVVITADAGGIAEVDAGVIVGAAHEVSR
jgi:hypothetical protein